MDFGSSIIGLIFLILCTIPFVILSIRRQNKINLLFESLNNLAKQNNCNISQKEQFSNFAIGLDENRNYLFFYKNKKNKEIAQNINLADIQSCRALNSGKIAGNGSGSSKLIDKLELGLTPKSNTGGDILLEFYSLEDSMQVNGELQVLEKWVALINDQLKRKR